MVRIRRQVNEHFQGMRRTKRWEAGRPWATVPPVARVTVTVQAPEEIGAMVAGVQVIPERVSVPVSANSEIVLVLEEPFIVAVTVTP